MRRLLYLLVVPFVVMLFAYAKPSTASLSQNNSTHEAAQETIQPPAPSADWTTESNAAESWFGTSVSTAGDLNGDGHLDLIVGAFGYDNGETNEGALFVYLGSATGLSQTPTSIIESNEAYAYFGWTVSNAGDVNADGYDDVIVGALSFFNPPGKAYLYLGSATGLNSTPAWIAQGEQTYAYFGWAVSNAGDVNADGYGDVIVGAPYYGNSEGNEGKAYLYLGSATGLSSSPAWTAEGEQELAYFGDAVSHAGDVNGDGYDDVYVGAYSYSNSQINEGRAFVYLGSATGLSSTPAWTAESEQADAEFGAALSSAGDVNGDGYDDLIVGAPKYDNSETDSGRAFVYLGSATGLDSTPAWAAEESQANAQFGAAVSSAGDVNGDGYDDVIVGAPYIDNPGTDSGQAFLYLASATGLSATPILLAEQSQADAHFGWAVSTAGDLNSDGYDDLIIGAPKYDNPETNEGRVFAYYGQGAVLPPDPIDIAPPNDETVVSDIYTDTRFIYTQEPLIQTGMNPDTIVPARVAVIRGQLLNPDNQPLSGVTISIKDHPEFGQTLSRADGLFDLVVNGGGRLTIEYKKTDFLPVQREVQTPWRDYVWADDVVMIALDEEVAEITLDENQQSWQVASASVVSDTDGERQATLLFPPATTAYMVLPDGITQTLSTADIRATEYTVGENGPEAMPGDLPPASGYTYAIELSVDEALEAGATTVEFNQPVPFYVDNFIGFPVGEDVPTGYYDREQAAWIAVDDGRVIKILSITNGMANLDVTGDGVASTGQTLEELGIDDGERQQLAALYPAETELWRVPITHFTPWDCNWPYGPPDDAVAPEGEEPFLPEWLEELCTRRGSIIGCESQTLGEMMELVGTSYQLVYQSERMPGRLEGKTLTIPIQNGSLPSSLQGVKLKISVAGQQIEQEWSNPGSIPTEFDFVWDGYDAYGRPMYGSHPVSIRIGYTYPAQYQSPSGFGNSFGGFGSGVGFSGSRILSTVTIWRRSEGVVRGFEIPKPTVGGWSLDMHHVYDPNEQTLYLGDGTRRSVVNDGQVISTYAGGNGDNRAATDIQLKNPAEIALWSNQNDQLYIFLTDPHHHSIRRIGPDGIMTTVAGNGVAGFSGDGGPASSAQLNTPTGLMVLDDGTLYIADTGNHRIRKVDTQGFITTVVGLGSQGFSGDGGAALEAELAGPRHLALASSDNGVAFYIADSGNHRIRYVAPDQTITTVVGDGTSCDSQLNPTCGDGGQAGEAQLIAPRSMAVASNGDLYLADPGMDWIRKVIATSDVVTTTDIIINALDLPFNLYPFHIALGSDESLYVSDYEQYYLYRFPPSGTPELVAGNGSIGTDHGDGGLATNAQLNPQAIAFDQAGNLYLADWASYKLWDGRVRRIDATSQLISTVAGGGFDDGRLAALNQLTEPSGMVFNAAGELLMIDDQRIRKINQDGYLTTIAGGQRCETWAQCGDGGLAISATFKDPSQLAIGLDESLYIADTENNRIRRIGTDGYIHTIVGECTTSDGNGDQGPALAACLNGPKGLAIASDGTLYISEDFHDRVRRVTPAGIISTVVGTCTATDGLGDDGPALAACLSNPAALAVASDGSLYIADQGHARVRRVRGSDGIITTVAGNGSSGFSGDGEPATSAQLGAQFGLTVSKEGDLYIADTENRRLRIVTVSGLIDTLAGTGEFNTGGDGGPATLAALKRPVAVALDHKGQIVVADHEAANIRRIGSALPDFDVNSMPIASQDGEQLYLFSPAGRHLRTLDARTGDRIYSFEYTDMGRLKRVIDRQNQVTSLTYGSDTVTITAPYGQQTILSLDENGYMDSYTNPAGETTSFGYTPLGLLLSMSLPERDGITPTYSFTYQNGRLVRDENPEGGFTELQRLNATNKGHTVLVSNALNDTTRYELEKLDDGSQQLVVTAPNGTTTTTITRPDGSRTVMTPDGNTTTIIEADDPRWGMQAPYIKSLTIQNTDGDIFYRQVATRTAVLSDTLNPLSLITLYDELLINGQRTMTIYDNRTRTMTTTNAAGQETVMTLDQLSRPQTAQISNRAPISYTYDEYGQLIFLTEGQRTTELHYEPTTGYLSSITDPLSGTTSYQYDAVGRLLTETLPTDHILSNRYDTNGNLIASRNAMGILTTYEYDLHNRLSGQTLDPQGRAVLATYGYDLADNLLTSIEDVGGLNVTTSFEYEAISGAGNYLPHEVTDASNHTVSVTYTSFGELETITDPLDRTTVISYTLEGWPNIITSPEGRTSETIYDAQGRPLQIISPGGSSTSYTYDEAGRLKGVTEGTTSIDGWPALNQTTQYAYNVNSQVITVTNPAGETSSFEYDHFGRLIATQDGLTGTITYDYDLAHRLIGQTVGGNVASEALTSLYSYDLAGRLLSTQVDPNGLNLTTQYRYTSTLNSQSWNLAQEIDPRGYATQYQYNSLGLIKETLDANGETWHYGYDNLGRLTSQTSPLNQVTTYQVDNLGRTRALTIDGRSESWLYNPDGTLDSYTDFANRTTSYSYDDDLLVTAIDYPQGTADVSFDYNQLGQVITMTDGLDATSYVYDAIGQLRERTRSGRTVSYNYDLTSRLSEIGYWGHGSVQYDYDEAGRLTDLTPWNASTTTYNYRSTGLIDSIIRPNGTSTSHEYDTASRLSGLLHAHGGTTLESIQYLLDATGNRTQMTDNDGTTTYAYDAINRLTEVDNPTLPTTNTDYQYDAVGNRLNYTHLPQNDSNSESTYTYDESSRITNAGFAYDDNGNLLSDGETTYTYDAANHLIQTVKDGITTQYDYDGWGNLIRETINDGTSSTTDFVLDERGLVRILGEVRVDGDELLYAYGPEGVAAQQTISSGPSGGVHYPLLDGQGSVRQLTDPSGTVVLSRSYDAFGNIRQQIGNTWSTLGYTGERHGTADGTIYLRARHYQPELGRFLQRDSWAGIYGRPQSLNRYSYVENNPMRFSDPTGHWPCLAGFGNCEDSGQTEEQLSQQRSNALDGVQAGIDVVGVVFDGADAINMAIYLGRGDCVNAAISAAAMIPAVGAAATSARWARRAETGVDAARAADNAADAARGGARYGDDVATATGRQADEVVGAACSFSEETLVATESGFVPIGEVDVGDLVLAWDQSLDSTDFYTVTAVWAHLDNTLVILTIDGEQIETTPEHPFYIADNAWVAAGELWLGARVKKADGRYGTVSAISVVDSPQVMYNLTVDEAHTFFVGQEEWLVHNACEPRYRGDTRTPQQITDAGGFHPQEPGATGSPRDIIGHVEGTGNSYGRYVSASDSAESAAPFGAPNYPNRTGYVYEFDDPGGGYDVTEAYEAIGRPTDSRYGEREIAYLEVKLEQIRRLRHVDDIGEMIGSWMPFP